MVRSSCQILDTVPTITGNGSNRLNTYCDQPRHHSKHQPQGLCPRISHLPSLQIPGRYNETTSRTKILFPSQPFSLLSAVTTSDSSANPSVICVSHGVPTWSNLSFVVCLRSIPFCGFTTVHKENGQYRQKGWMEVSVGVICDRKENCRKFVRVGLGDRSETCHDVWFTEHGCVTDGR